MELVSTHRHGGDWPNLRLRGEVPNRNMGIRVEKSTAATLTPSLLGVRSEFEAESSRGGFRRGRLKICLVPVPLVGGFAA